jgi:hypothetical protein
MYESVYPSSWSRVSQVPISDGRMLSSLHLVRPSRSPGCLLGFFLCWHVVVSVGLGLWPRLRSDPRLNRPIGRRFGRRTACNRSRSPVQVRVAFNLCDMSLTSEQAVALNGRPRIPPDVEDQAVSMWAEGSSDAEVQVRFPTWAVGTFRNLRGRKKAEIDDLRRQRTVQFSDVAGTRKQARIDDHWQIRTAYMMLFRKHLESCYAMDPATGEKEFFEQLVDVKRLQMYSSEIRAELKALMIETGQQMQMPEEYTRYALGLNSGEGIDHAKMAQRRREPQQQEDAGRKWRIEHAEEVADDEVDRLLSLAKIRKQPPPTLQRLANAAHEALEDIEDDAVHDRVDRWLEERFPGGVVGAELGDQDSDQAVTRPDVVDHGPVAAVVAAGVDESDGQGRTGAGCRHHPSDTSS